MVVEGVVGGGELEEEALDLRCGRVGGIWQALDGVQGNGGVGDGDAGEGGGAKEEEFARVWSAYVWRGWAGLECAHSDVTHISTPVMTMSSCESSVL